jgi:hypothetical protein
MARRPDGTPSGKGLTVVARQPASARRYFLVLSARSTTLTTGSTTFAIHD